jgi:hypothetical protein
LLIIIYILTIMSQSIVWGYDGIGNSRTQPEDKQAHNLHSKTLIFISPNEAELTVSCGPSLSH